MVYGFGETGAQRVEHLMKVRDQQDKTGGFTAFIPWSFSQIRPNWIVRARYERNGLFTYGCNGSDYIR